MKLLRVLLLAAGAAGFAMSPNQLPQPSSRVAMVSPLTMKMGGGFGRFNPFKGENGANNNGGTNNNNKKNQVNVFRKTPSSFLGGWFSGKPSSDGTGGNVGEGSGGGNFRNGEVSPLDSSASGDDDDSSSSSSESSGLWAAYEKALAEKPIIVKGATSFCGFTIGDLLAQFFIEKKQYDPWRTLRLASFGFLVHGTTSHWFYGKLDAAIPGTGGAQVASKVFIDQVLWNPIFGVMFFGYMGIFEGSGIAGTITKIKNDLITQVTGSWTVWPLAHAINFRYIPTEQRVLYINTIQIFYNCFLSVIGNRKPEPAAT